jgi:hypothetical protein
MNAFGKRKWIIPGGHVPLKSTGREPDFLSQDRLAILNTGIETAKIEISVFYTNKEPVSYQTLEIKAKRLRKIRINDLINPAPVYLETDYALVIESDHNVVIQFLRMDTGNSGVSVLGTIAFNSD